MILNRSEPLVTAGGSDQTLLDLTQMGLDIAGILDPTPISDGSNGVISLFRGDLLGAGISVVGFIPYLGDIAKLGKVKKWANVVERVVKMARTDARFAEFVGFAMKKIKGLLDSIPLDKLPRPMREAIEKLKAKVDDFFGGTPNAPNSTPPNAPKTPNAGPEPPKVDKVRVGDVELPATTAMSVQDSSTDTCSTPNIRPAARRRSGSARRSASRARTWTTSRGR